MALTREERLFETIVQKAWDDRSFKEALISNPLNAIHELTGEQLTIPEGKTLVVTDQTDDKIIYVNIPAKKSVEDMELTEEQLDIISGGGDPPAVIQTDVNPFQGMLLG